jgi:pimeloyl-ACP methyl ester carboxylesterase
VAAIAATTLSVALAGTSLVQSASGAPRTQAHEAKSYTPPPIQWHHCAKGSTLAQIGAQCGYLIVPMDYAHPHGTTIKVAVSRRMHTSSQADYQGVMLVNPGGPGGSGLVYAALPDFYPDSLPASVANTYDWIGFDPRGVGSSRPELSCDKNFTQGPRPAYIPTNHKLMARWIHRSKAYAKDCTTKKGAALFHHVKTVDSVRDMESLRKALGQQKLNFYGFSYGTYLGSVYMSLHPNRVRRFVLDSTVDPRHVWYQANLDQDVAFQKTFNVYFSWLAKHHKVFHVGATHKAVRKLFLATEAKLNAHPRGFLGGDELLDVFTSAGYYVYNWTSIANEYSALINHNDAKPLMKDYKGSFPTTKADDNGYTMYLATQCTDTQWPQSQAKLNRDSRRVYKKASYFTWANAWFNGPCAYWHYKPAHHLVHVSGKHVTVPILMIDETYDPATPYEGSLYVRKIFPTASLIEGKNGTTHAGTLSGVKCTDRAIDRYLADGTVPTRKPGNHSDKVCPPVPPPAAKPSGSASSVVSPDLHAQISRGLVH